MVVRPTTESPIFTPTAKKSKTVNQQGEPRTPAPKNDWLKSVLDSAIESNQPLWSPAKQHFRGSWAGTQCVRALTFKAAGHNVPHKARTKRIFQVGNAIEAAIVETLGVGGVLLDTQIPVLYDDPPIVGKADVTVQAPDGKAKLGEVKSINEHQFKKLPREHDAVLASASPLFAIKASYVEQWNTYACSPNNDWSDGFILFEEKNTSEDKVYWLERDDELSRVSLDRMRRAARYVTASVQKVAPIPDDRNPHKGDPVCVGCSHRYICKLVPEEGTTIGRVREIDATVRDFDVKQFDDNNEVEVEREVQG